jgi:hypothetical protein
MFILHVSGLGIVACTVGVEGAENPVQEEQQGSPTCGTMFIGTIDGDWHLVDNWSNGLPRPGVTACFIDEASRDARSVAATQGGLGYSNPPAPTAIGACCLGSSCMITDYFECQIQGGYFRENQVFCDGGICDTGACCTDTPACADDDGGGGSMDEEVCDIRGGVYLGGALCNNADSCQRFRLPPGYEIVEASAGTEQSQHGVPRLNNCGEIVFHIGAHNEPPAVILYYDNGNIASITTTSEAEVIPDINDNGAVALIRGVNGLGGGSIALVDGATSVIVGLGTGAPSINSAGNLTWSVEISKTCPGPRRDAIDYFNGVARIRLIDDGLSNQSVQLNSLGHFSWTHYHFPCEGGFGDWTSDIARLASGTVTYLPSEVDTPQGPDIDDIGRVGWGSFDLVEVWQGGQTTSLTDGHRPSMNNMGDISYTFKTDTTPWQLLLLHENEYFQITNDRDIGMLMDNIRPDINNAGEIAWWWHPNGDLTPSGIRFMRRIRNGDVDFDGDVDVDDFVAMPGCFTGPGDFDRLCECRFYDIDHDRDIDQDDFDLFMRVYSGPIEDCDGNSTIDFQDLIDGTHSDCNANGVPDQCDLEEATRQRGNEATRIRAATVRERNETGRQQGNEATSEGATKRRSDGATKGDQENGQRGGDGAIAIDNLQSQIDDSNEEIATPVFDGLAMTDEAGSVDLDGDGVPDECCGGSAPALADVEGVKNRVLSIQIGQPRTIAPTNPLPPRPPQALRVTFVPDGVASLQTSTGYKPVPHTIRGGIDNPQSPIDNPQSPIDNPQSPIDNRQSAIGNSNEEIATPVFDGLAMTMAGAGWSMYVGPPKEVCENSGQGFNVNPADCASVGNRPKTFTVATLRCEPYFTDWHEVGAVYVYHPAIAPEGQFVVQTINDGCGLSAESNYSAGLNLATGKFGDTVSTCATNPCGPPNAVIDAADVLAALDKFRNTPTSSRKFRVDLEPATLDGFINVSDITMVLNAFSGAAYPFETPTPTCP